MIIVECYLDEYLIRSLGFSKQQIRHKHGKGRVVKSIYKLQGKIGVIDEDPDSSQPNELKNYSEIMQTENLKLLRRKASNNQYLIIISPYLEEWILKRALYNQIKLDDYGLEPDAKLIHNIPHIEKKVNFQDFLSDLIDKDKEIGILHKWLSKYS